MYIGIVSVGNRCMLVLCPWGTGVCWYCVRGERVSVGIVSVGNMFLLVLYLWGTCYCWYYICGEHVTVGIVSVGNRFLLVLCPLVCRASVSRVPLSLYLAGVGRFIIDMIHNTADNYIKI